MSRMHLSISRVSKTYPGNVQALQNVSLAVPRGQILCLLGPNGAGKGTLVQCIAGLLSPDAEPLRRAASRVDPFEWLRLDELLGKFGVRWEQE